jgi:lysophospholipase L1-like esterase
MAKTKKLFHLGEFGLLKKLLPSLYWPKSLHSQLCIGPGDDAGALKKEWTNDGLHPNDAGYQAIMPLAQAAIDAILK